MPTVLVVLLPHILSKHNSTHEKNGMYLFYFNFSHYPETYQKERKRFDTDINRQADRTKTVFTFCTLDTLTVSIKPEQTG